MKNPPDSKGYLSPLVTVAAKAYHLPQREEEPMKKSILALVLVSLVVAPALAQTRLDVKTKLTEKMELKGVKHGVIFYLEKAGYKIVEIKPEYAVWLTDFTEKRLEGNKYAIAFTVKIAKPKVLGEGEILAKQDLESEFSFDPKILDTDTGFVKFIKAKVKDAKEKDQIEAMQIGKLAADAVQTMLAGIAK